MLVSLFRLLSHLPLRALHALGAALGWLVWLASPSYRRRMRENMARAGYSQHLRAAIGEAGKSVLELPFVWCAPEEKVVASAEMADWEVLDEALREGRGVVTLTPHLGCFELLAIVVSRRMPLTVLYRPPRKESLKPLMEGARARPGLALAPANLSGVRQLLKGLKRGEMVGLLPDQVPQNGEGVWADFYGKPAYTMTLSAKLQQMSGSPMLICYAERKPRGAGFLLRFVRFDEPMGETPEQQAAAINRAMEKLIARCPQQYFWSYNRYKVPPGVAAPGEHEGQPS